MFLHILNKPLLVVLITVSFIKCTIDMNVAEFQYLADHLTAEECRELIAVLHFTTYYPPKAAKEADISCFHQLLHWNGETNQGKNETHELVARRLRQIGRYDLSDWLSKIAFGSLSHDIDRNIADILKIANSTVDVPLTEESEVTNSTPASTAMTQSPFANNSVVRIGKQDYPPPNANGPPVYDGIEPNYVDVDSDLDTPTEWTAFDSISWTIVAILLIIIIALMIKLCIATRCCNKKRKSRRFKRKKYDMLSGDEESTAATTPAKAPKESPPQQQYQAYPVAQQRPPPSPPPRPPQPSYHPRSVQLPPEPCNSGHKVDIGTSNESMTMFDCREQNRDALELMGCDMPMDRSPRCIIPRRTIDITQSIKLPFTNLDKNNRFSANGKVTMPRHCN